MLLQDDEDIKDDLIDDASQSGGDGHSGTDSESQNSIARTQRVKKRKVKRDM